MGIKNIMQAKKILVVVSGEDKAAILKEVLYGPITPEVPASILQLHNDVTIVADAAALSKNQYVDHRTYHRQVLLLYTGIKKQAFY